MTQDRGKDLDSHLDRLMETAYEALASGTGEHRRREAPPAEPEVPDHIGPYPVSGLLGRGGTSFVWKGRDPELGRDLAIKVIDRRHAPDGPLARRFLDEARICSQLSHPGIVPIYDVGQLEDGRPYFTMRLVEGETLAAMLDARRGPDERLQQFLEIFTRVCETVAFAHARGIVHGDLKPANVMVGAYGQVQVMDWGFSRLVAPSAADAAQGAAGPRAMGTPAFMAPEQAGPGNTVDARTDVFGLGAILCVILTNAPPFAGGSRSETLVRAAQGCLGDALLRLRECRADAELVRLAEHCLQRSPDARPADADQVAARVSAWFVSIKERAHRLELAAAQAKVEAKEQRRTRRRTVALAMLAVAFAAVYAWMQFERQARDYETRMVVAQAIERARNLRTGADIAGPERIRWLGEAAVAAQHARTLAATLDDTALQDEAGQLSRRLDGDRDAAVRDETMVRWLDDFPSHLDLTRDQLDFNIAEGFRRFGVDVEGLPADDVVARLRESSIAPALARELDDWGFVRRRQQGVAAAAWRRFHEIALRVDEDPQRSAVRRALLAGDRGALRDLADSPEFRDAATDTLDLLANCLAQANQRQAAISVWQRANERHPDSVRVIHSLAVHHFNEASCPPWDEIVRLFTAGTALRPGSAHLWTDLSFALAGQGNVAAAEAALQRALELAPRDERALANLVDLLRCQGRQADALACCQAVAERAPDAAAAFRLHGDSLLLDGYVQRATDVYRRAVAIEASAVHRERLGRCLLQLGDLDAAIGCFRAALALEATNTSAQAHLGLALRQQGRFAEAVAALQRGRGTESTAWSRQCDAWIEETRRAEDFSRSLADLGNAPSQLEQALVAHLAGHSWLAARCYRDVFERDPAAANGRFLGENRDWAVLAAVAVSTGAGSDAAAPGAEERAAWRNQAMAWQRDAIAALRRDLDSGVATPASVRQRIDAWRHAPAPASLLPELQADLDQLGERLAVEPGATVHAPFDRSYTFRMLGSPPGVLKPYGGLLLDGSDPDVLVVAGHAQRLTAALCQVSLTRDARGHVDGFRGTARHLAAAPFADGGIARGPKDVLFYTRYPNSEVGQLRAGSRMPDRVDKLDGPTSGGFAIVPPGLPGAGRSKRLAWPGGEWFDAELAPESLGFALTAQEQVATLAGGPDGFAYVPAGACFEQPALLVAEWSQHSIAAYEIDENGDPVPSTRRLVLSGCRGVLALAIDHATGDVLVSTWRGDGTEQIGVLQRR